jgi:tripartite-type tricarboxylate transporter receptor subunit TctC
MPWDILKDFEPVRWWRRSNGAWWCTPRRREDRGRPDRQREKRRPQVNYGSGGNGSPQHIAMALFASQAGCR